MNYATEVHSNAIRHMHEKGVFHRDIKSPNICFGENFEIPKIIDCGIASLLPEDRLNGNQSAFTRQSFTVKSWLLTHTFTNGSKV